MGNKRCNKNGLDNKREREDRSTKVEVPTITNVKNQAQEEEGQNKSKRQGQMY